MYRPGRTLFYITALALFASLSLAPARAVAGTYEDCLKDLARAAVLGSAKIDRLATIKAYNSAIQRPVADLSNTQLNREFAKAVDLLHPINRSFPKDDFLKWSELTPFTEAELAAMKAENKTIGDALHAKAGAFEKSKESIHFDQAISELKEHLKDLRALCGKDVSCHEAELSKLVRKNKGWFSCLRSNPDALAGAISAFAVSNAGFLVNDVLNASRKSKEDRSWKDGSYDIYLNIALWTPILSEIGCKNTFKASTEMVGKPAQTAPVRTSFKTKIKTGANTFVSSWWNYWKFSWANEASYMVFHKGLEAARGHEVDLDPMNLAKEWVMYMAWDAAVGVPRNMGMDQFTKYYSKLKPAGSRSGQGIAKRAVYEMGNFGTRAGVSFASSFTFRHYEGLGRSLLFDPAVTPSSKPGGASKPTTPPSDRPPSIDTPPAREVVVAIPPKNQKHYTCDELAAIFEKCQAPHYDRSEEMDAFSSKYHNPTFKECIDELEALEKQCGSYW